MDFFGVLKRRSSVIESDIGSFGPIHRIRRKSNLVSPLRDMTLLFPRKFLHPTTNALDNVQTSTFSAHMPLTSHEPKYDTPHWKAAENGEGKGGHLSVPPQSSEMARKILQQLDKFVPSPKEKSSEAKTLSMHESPPKLTLDMLHGQALKSVAEIDSSKVFNLETNGKVDGPDYSPLGSSASLKQDKVQGNGNLQRLLLQSLKGHQKPKVWTVTWFLLQMQGPLRDLQTPSSHILLLACCRKNQDSQCRLLRAYWSLMMTATTAEMMLLVLQPLEREKRKHQRKNPIFSSEAQVTKKPLPFSSESKVASGLTLSKEPGKGVPDRLAVADKDTGFTFQVVPPQTQPPLTPTMPSPTVEKSAQLSEQITAPTITFSSKTTPSPFPSSMTSFTEPSSLKFGAKSELKGALFGSIRERILVAAVFGEEGLKSH